MGSVVWLSFDVVNDCFVAVVDVDDCFVLVVDVFVAVVTVEAVVTVFESVVEFVLFSIVVKFFKGVFSPFSLLLGSILPYLFC